MAPKSPSSWDEHTTAGERQGADDLGRVTLQRTRGGAVGRAGKGAKYTDARVCTSCTEGTYRPAYASD